MTKKATGIVAYITLIGWIIAFCTGDREGAKVHLNNALLLWIANLIGGVVAVIPIIGWIVGCVVSIAVFVFWIMGLIWAIQEQDKEIPLIGGIQILK